MNIIDANNNEKTLARALTLTATTHSPVHRSICECPVVYLLLMWSNANFIANSQNKLSYYARFRFNKWNKCKCFSLRFTCEKSRSRSRHTTTAAVYGTQPVPYCIRVCVFVLILTEDTIWRTGPKPGIKRTVTANKNENTESNWN